MKKILALILILNATLFGAAFNATDSIINVPIAKHHKEGEIQFGGSFGYNGSPSIQVDEENRYEMDFKAVYSLTHQHQFALNLVNSDRAVLHHQYTLSKEYETSLLAVGLRNITGSPYSTWTAGEYVESVNMSPYIVNTFYNMNTLFSIGYGLNVFQHNVSTLSGVGEFIENLNGLFFGFAFTKEVLTLMAEYDGKDINFGIRLMPNENFEFNIALTEQFVTGDYNPQHANAPKRQITFGISSRNIFSYDDYYNNRIKNLNEQISDLQQIELERKDKEMKNIDEEIITQEDILKSKVAELYSKALEKYNSRNYNEAIKALEDALEIDPNNFTILTRLGSIYYTYGFLDHAAFYWKKAYYLNPDSPDMYQIKEFITKY